MIKIHHLCLILLIAVASCGREHSSESSSQGDAQSDGDAREFSNEVASGKFAGEPWNALSAQTLRLADGSFKLMLSPVAAVSPCSMKSGHIDQFVSASLKNLSVGTVQYPIDEHFILFNSTKNSFVEEEKASGKIRITMVTTGTVEGNIVSYLNSDNYINGRFKASYCP